MVSSRSFGQLPPRLYKLASELALLSRILLTSTLELLSRSALPCTARAATFCLLLNRTPPSTPASTLTSHGYGKGLNFFHLNGICYEALEDLRERIEMDFIHNQGTYLRQEAYGQPMTDRVPVGSEHLLSKIKALYVNNSNHDGEGTSSRNIHVQANHINDEVHDYQSTSRLVTLLDSLSLREKHNDAIMQQPSDVPKSSKNLLTKIKALYDNTPKHPGEGTSSKNIHVQISQMHHGEVICFCHDYQSTSRLAALPDKLSLREDHNDAVRNHYEDIEEINIEVPFEDRPPLYAHVTFHSQLTLFRVLDGNIRVNFMTCSGKHIRARQFVPKKKK
ncbi:hypothetical protein ZWY2020_037491 [Hordeum vulgare]|nr:hypothetical protein ZWY2020_037491 [Hordeum vulgare]